MEWLRQLANGLQLSDPSIVAKIITIAQESRKK